MERLPDGQYDENNKEAQLDHSMLSDFIRSEDGNRDLSATVSCHNEVLKDLINKQQELGKAHTYIEQLQKQNELLEARLVKLEAMIENKPLK
jgi:phosphoenolpyruvate carboxylase